MAAMLRIALAGLHLLALGLGLGAVLSRGTALRGPPSQASLARAFRADTLWGIAAALWIGTGLWRVLAGTDKTIQYYLHNHLFYAKMGLLALILALEIWPMVTLIRLRVAVARGVAGDVSARVGALGRIATISYIEATIVVVMIFIAVAIARGYGGS
jgi:putative membrane protein